MHENLCMNTFYQTVNYIIYDPPKGRERPEVCPHPVGDVSALSDAVRATWVQSRLKAQHKGRLVSKSQLEGRLSALKTQVSGAESIKRAWREYKSRPTRSPVQMPECSELTAAETIQRVWRRSKARRLLTDPVRQEATREPTAIELDRIPQLLKGGHRTAMARAVNVANVLKDTHYLFLHSVDRRISILHQLLTSVKSARPSSVYCGQTAVSLQYSASPPANANAEAYLSNCDMLKEELDDTVKREMADLVSVNSYLFDATLGESALYFFSGPSNVSNFGHQSWPTDPTGKKCWRLIRDVTQAPSLRVWWNRQLNLLRPVTELSKVGNSLYLIAVPKQTLDDPERGYAYLSHSLGEPCSCGGTPKEDRFKAVTQDYNGANQCKPPQYRCVDNLESAPFGYTQHRLLRTNLERDPGKLIFTFAADEASAKEQKAKVRPLQRAMQDIVRLESIGSNLSARTIESILLRLDLDREDELYQKGIREILYHKRQVLEQYQEYLLDALPEPQRALLQEVLEGRIPAPQP